MESLINFDVSLNFNKFLPSVSSSGIGSASSTTETANEYHNNSTDILQSMRYTFPLDDTVCIVLITALN